MKIIISKGIKDYLPKDWGESYENVLLQVTTENQKRADERLPILFDIPAKHKGFMAAPFIGEVDAEKYLATGQMEEVLCGGENYDGARPCHYEWVKKLSDQCRKYDVTFDFIETGTVFVKEGKTYRIPDKRTQLENPPHGVNARRIFHFILQLELWQIPLIGTLCGIAYPRIHKAATVHCLKLRCSDKR